MKKRVLLISGSLSKNHPDHLSGADRDIINYCRFFSSAIGGAFLESEITILQNPSSDKIEHHTKLNCGSDVNIIVFSGHGETDAYSGVHYIWINDNEKINVGDLYNSSNRQVFILDSCRIEQQANHFDGLLGDPLNLTFDNRNLDLARKMYDRQLEDCAYGRYFLFSSGYGEASYGDNSGGIYSRSLLGTISAWYKHGRATRLTLYQAFQISKYKMKKGPNYYQVPSFYATTGFHEELPFAINPMELIRRVRLEKFLHSSLYY
jgi:hypothetical protein